MQINKSFLECSSNMNAKYLVLVAAMAVMLIGATALATDDAFADKKRHDDKKKGGYGKSQATAQTNYCGNGEAPLNVGSAQEFEEEEALTAPVPVPVP
jgi:hypothetical protein